MKNMIERLLEARAARREDREAGFSLIELIVVIAIIGILIAIAIPVYGSIQDKAKVNQIKNAAATAATAVGAAIAEGKTVADDSAGNITGAIKKSSEIEYELAGSTLEDFCVTATGVGDLATASTPTATSGPGC